jgi:hypothetical protein
MSEGYVYGDELAGLLGCRPDHVWDSLRNKLKRFHETHPDVVIEPVSDIGPGRRLRLPVEQYRAFAAWYQEANGRPPKETAAGQSGVGVKRSEGGNQNNAAEWGRIIERAHKRQLQRMREWGISDPEELLASLGINGPHDFPRFEGRDWGTTPL